MGRKSSTIHQLVLSYNTEYGARIRRLTRPRATRDTIGQRKKALDAYESSFENTYGRCYPSGKVWNRIAIIEFKYQK